MYFDKLKKKNKIKAVNIFTFHLYVNSDRMFILFVYSLFYHLQLPCSYLVKNILVQVVVCEGLLTPMKLQYFIGQK